MAVRGGPPQQQADSLGFLAPNDGLEYRLERDKNACLWWRCVRCNTFVTEGHINSKKHQNTVTMLHANQQAPPRRYGEGRQQHAVSPDQQHADQQHAVSPTPTKARRLTYQQVDDGAAWGPRTFRWSETIDTTNLVCHPSERQHSNMMWFETYDCMPKKLKMMERGFTHNEHDKMAAQDRESGLLRQCAKKTVVIEERTVEVMVAGGTSLDSSR